MNVPVISSFDDKTSVPTTISTFGDRTSAPVTILLFDDRISAPVIIFCLMIEQGIRTTFIISVLKVVY